MTMSLLKWSFLLVLFVNFKAFSIEEPKAPILSTSALIERYNPEGELKGIILIEREGEPLKMSLPGGRVKYGESVEQAIRREIEDQLNVNLFALRQFHVYSEPSRIHTVTVAQMAKTYKEPKEGKGVASISVVPLDEIPWNQLSVDDAQILKDYLSYKEGNTEIIMIKHG